MNVLLKKATIISPAAANHLQVKDILITNGVIKQIADDISGEGAQLISGSGLHVSAGWIDIFADFSEPGNEQKETLESGANAAAAGGFTQVMLMPNTSPAVSSKAQVEFINQRAKNLPVTLYAIGSVTKNTEGKELAEMYDMHASGAVAFSDGRNSVQQSGILLKALQYVAAKNAVLIQVPDDKSISDGGFINEGIVSTRLGLQGKPAIAEELMIARDLELLKYTNSALHITGISTAKSVELITAAKKEGLKVTCSVTPYHLYFSDEDMESYDTNLKVNPPLRRQADVQALRDALKAGVIDCITTHHTAQHWDDKVCEFEYAKNGMIGLQTLYGTVNGFTTDATAFVQMVTENPAKIFGLGLQKIEEGAAASLTIFEPSTEYIFEEKMILSKSKNSPFIGKKMQGKVVGIIHKNKVVIN
jgi:dihydroorotase